MKYIANVVSKSKKYKFNEFINVTNSYDDIDHSVPTLVVGTEMVKSIFGNSISYIDRKINKNTSWTFSTVEKRSSNEEDIEKFKEDIIKVLKKRINYRYIDVTSYDFMSFDGFVDEFLKNKEIFYLFTDKMLYLSKMDEVKGISLDFCEYLGWKKDDIISKVVENTKNVTSIHQLPQEIDKNFFKNDEILLSAMFCYLNR